MLQTKKNKKLKEQEESLEKEILKLETNLENRNEKREAKLKGTLLRAKAQIYIDFEKPTKFFSNLEKQKNISKVLYKVKSADKIVTSQKNILKELEVFYKNLLKSHHKDNHALQNNPF